VARAFKSTISQAYLTTAQQLGSIVKSCRDIMRKDKGLSGDLDRLPMLVWVMFLKFIDDMETLRESEAFLKGERFRPAIEAPYRWRVWGGTTTASTGTLSSLSSARIRQCGLTAARARGSSATCAVCRVRTEATGGM